MTEISDAKPDRGEQKLIDNVAQYGWHCAFVGSRVDDPVQVTFAYSVGLPFSAEWPEFICFGLEMNVLHHLLANAIDELRASKAVPRAGLLLQNVMNNYACRLDEFPLHQHRDHLGQVCWS